ncbi:unnamed protein product [Brugia timori]|uniref:Ras-associating domain-containing protein n=1 Tax=Brugia timori TaxID=42155 RepID=A0A0R3R3G5_9BILA|nr:unnamed protein product [Brugia timori]
MVADRDREDEYEALEIHRMSFFYDSDQAEMILTREVISSKSNRFRITQARKQFFHLIRRVTAYENMMDPLPQNICTIFKLTYYDEKTNLFRITTSVHSIFMKSVTEMKSLMQADTNQFSNPVSRDTTICSSPTKILRSFSACSDEFSQIQTVDNEQQNDSIQSIELMTSSSFIDISGTLEITKICHTPSNTCDKDNSNDTS